MPNRLAGQTSPYLLQHANNPVDWYPWGPEALERAQREDKPIFLSIGYSACHWCHVMEHESFEDPELARQLNESFISIKVDREERPDLDQIYMNAVQLITGRGGWPMSVFLTPDMKPFYGGTYWPPRGRMGMPGFDQVLTAVIDAWQNRRDKALQSADEITTHLQSVDAVSTEEVQLNTDLIRAACQALERSFDFQHGGFGQAPKFPHAMQLQLLLRVWGRTGFAQALEMVRLNLDKMACGGIYDHLAGGFARYSVDERWLVPHFEKMLYDNALLTTCYLQAFQATADEHYERVVRETLDYVLHYMTDGAGGFYSAEDADSEGEEGKFYVWTPEEIHAVLGSERGERFCLVYDVTPAGNFERHTSILNLPKTVEQFAALRGLDAAQLEELKVELAESRAALLAVRDQRVRPGRDDKVLVNWNGLMIDAMARAGAVLQEARYVEAAERAARFLLQHVRRDDGRLLHTWRRGQAQLSAYLDDYACLASACVTLYESTFNESWIEHAVGLSDAMIELFADPAGHGFFFTASDHQQLIARQRDLHDSSVPSGNAMAATVLARLGKLTGRVDYLERAARTLKATAHIMQRVPLAAGQSLLALDFLLGPTQEIVLLGECQDASTREVLDRLRRRYVPSAVVALRSPTGGSPTTTDAASRSAALDAIFQGKSAGDELPVLFICESFQCGAPARGRAACLSAVDEISRQLTDEPQQ